MIWCIKARDIDERSDAVRWRTGRDYVEDSQGRQGRACKAKDLALALQIGTSGRSMSVDKQGIEMQCVSVHIVEAFDRRI